MKLKELDSLKLLPSWCDDYITRAVFGVFDAYARTLSSRLESLPCNASRDSLENMNDTELNTLADDLQLIAYNKGFSRDWRINNIFTLSGAFENYGTPNGVRKVIEASTPANIIGIDINENGDNAWSLVIHASDPLPILAAKIYERNALESSRVSQEITDFRYMAEIGGELRIGAGAVMGIQDVEEIDEVSPDPGPEPDPPDPPDPGNYEYYTGYLSSANDDVDAQSFNPWTYNEGGGYQELGAQYKDLYDREPWSFVILSVYDSNNNSYDPSEFYFTMMDGTGNLRVSCMVGGLMVNRVNYRVDVTNLNP